MLRLLRGVDSMILPPRGEAIVREMLYGREVQLYLESDLGLARDSPTVRVSDGQSCSLGGG